jgi:hypothetical protein
LTLINKGIYYNQLKQKGGYMKIQNIEVNPDYTAIQQLPVAPFIVTTSFDESQGDLTYDDIAAFGFAMLTREEWEAKRLEQRIAWFAAYPSGICFEVRQSDGGCNDRSTSKGCYSTLQNAISAAKGII